MRSKAYAEASATEGSLSSKTFISFAILLREPISPSAAAPADRTSGLGSNRAFSASFRAFASLRTNPKARVALARSVTLLSLHAVSSVCQASALGLAARVEGANGGEAAFEAWGVSGGLACDRTSAALCCCSSEITGECARDMQHARATNSRRITCIKQHTKARAQPVIEAQQGAKRLQRVQSCANHRQVFFLLHTGPI